MRFLIIFFIFPLCLPLASLAAGKEKKAEVKDITLIAQRSMSYGMEQVVLLIKGKKITFSANSNLLEEPGADAFLGLYESNLDSAWSMEKTDLDLIAKKIGELKGKQRKPEPHELFIKFNGKIIFKDSPYFSGLLDLLTRALDIGSWQPLDGLKVTYAETGMNVEKSGVKSKPRKAKKDKCVEDAPQRIRCRIDNYGTVYFAKIKPTES